MESQALLFHMLPVELGIMVLEYLTPRDVCTSFAPTCRQAYALSNNPLLWSSFYHRILLAANAGEEDTTTLMAAAADDEEVGEREDDAQARGQSWERLWLLDAGMTVGEAIGHSHTIDWKREYIRRFTFKVLVLAHHGAHGSSRYDINLCKQLKSQNINYIRICHPDCQAASPKACSELDNGGFKCVPFTPDVAKDFSAILLFHATAPSKQNKVVMGDVLYEHLESGGGVVLCCYAYLKENHLAGKWTPHFYPMPSSSFSTPEPHSNPRLGTSDDHPIMNGVRKSRTKIDNSRDTARCKTDLRPGAHVVARYADGPPMVVLYDSKANQANSKRPSMPKGRGKEDDDSDSDSEPRNKSANKPPTVAVDDEKSNINMEGMTEEIKETTEAETWGKTVFVNLFPVSNEDSRLGGWYPPAPQSDIPRLLSNALCYVARKKTPNEPSS